MRTIPNQLIRSGQSSITICLITALGLASISTVAFSSAVTTTSVSASSSVPHILQQTLEQADLLIGNKKYDDAAVILNNAINTNQPGPTNSIWLAKLWQRLAVLSRRQGEHYTAIDQLNKAVDLARQANKDNLLSSLLYDLGSAYLSVSEYDSAITALTQAQQVLTTPFSKHLNVRININLAHALIENKVKDGLEERLQSINEGITKLGDSKEKAELYLSLGRLYQTAQKTLQFSSQWRAKSYDAYRQAYILTKNMDDPLLFSYANGFMGQLYEDEHRIDEAMRYTRHAIFKAQTAQANDSLFKWEWQAARLLKAENKNFEALQTYRQAIETLQKVRLSLLLSAKSNFQRYIAPVYYQYIDLLLSQAATQSDSRLQDQLRQEAISALENYKIAEVEDYFQSACVDADVDDTPIFSVDPYTAVIYPIILKDRIEIIVSLKDNLVQFTNPVDSERFIKTVRQFRVKVENPRLQSDYLQYAQALYEWLIKPIEPTLRDQKITNLTFIPDGPLRSIPMSALHDGKQFLVEKFTTASTPSLSLTHITSTTRASTKVLVNGVTKAVQGYDALPSVNIELDRIGGMYPAVTLRDEQFLISRAEQELSEGEYSIVHIATHGEFSSDYRNSYLLTYDDKLTMSKLEKTIGVRKYEEQPLELLVLSACQTAVGDDRAALGLAGVAIKAGARSAVATLWFINDEATSRLMTEFYHQLKTPTVTKAQALQNAQLTLINSNNRNHPYYWAPFLLLGNWL